MALFGRGQILGRPPSAGGDTPHQRVAAWVSSHSSDVIAYYPMSDATTSGAGYTMADHGPNNLDGGFFSVVDAGTIDGETVGNFPGTAATAQATVSDVANWDSIAGIFCVIELDANGAVTSIVDRDTTTGSRCWQFRMNASNVLQLLAVGGGNPTKTGSTALSTSTRYTIGAGYVGGVMKLYVNGAAETTSGGAPTFNTGSSALYFGYHGGSPPDQTFNGRMGSVVLLSTASDAYMTDLHDAWLGN